MSETETQEEIKNILTEYDLDWIELKNKQLIVDQLTRSLPTPATPEIIKTHVLNYIANEPPF